MNIHRLIEVVYNKARPVRRMSPGTVTIKIQTPEGDKDIAMIEVVESGPYIRIVPTLR